MMNHSMPSNNIPAAQERTRKSFFKRKQTLRQIFLIGTIFLSFFNHYSQAQCVAGYQQAILNWDYLDYFTYTGNYTSANGYLPSNAASRTQNFAFGTQRLTIGHNYTDANAGMGENKPIPEKLVHYGNVILWQQ